MNQVTSLLFGFLIFDLRKPLLRTALALMFILLCVWQPAQAHSVPTHMNITRAAVDYLLATKAEFKCDADHKEALTNLLLIGTAAEDSNYDDNSPLKMGRYQFHFTPALKDSMFATPRIKFRFTVFKREKEVDIPGIGVGGDVEANCSSEKWSGFNTDGKGSISCKYVYPLEGRIWPIEMTNHYTWGNTLTDNGTVNEANIKTEKEKVMKSVIAANTTAQKEFRAKFSSSFDKSSKLMPKFNNGFYRLGYLMHHMQDQTSPAHAWNASHGHKAFPVKGNKIDVGFPEAMEADAQGEEIIRVPKMPSGGLVEKRPGEMFKDLHNEVRSKSNKRDNMQTQTARVVKRATDAFIAYLKGLSTFELVDAAVHPKQDWAKFKGLLQSEVDTEVKSILQKQKQSAGEWETLGPLAVKYSASLIWAYITTAKPNMPEQCKVTTPSGK